MRCKKSFGIAVLLPVLISTLFALRAPAAVTVVDHRGNHEDSLSKSVLDTGAGKQLLLVEHSVTLMADLTIPENLELWVPQGGRIVTNGHNLVISRLSEATGAYHIFDTSGGGSVKFAPGAVTRVFPQWWGTAGADWGPAFAAAIRAAAGGMPVCVPDGTYRVDTQVPVTVAGTQITMSKNAVITLNSLCKGTPASHVHNHNPVLAGMKVSAARFGIRGGRINGAPSYDGITICGILLTHGADDFKAYETEFHGLYTSIWAGGNIVNFVGENLVIDGCYHNMYVGYDEGVAGGVQQVTKMRLVNLTSRNSTNDGLKLGCFADQVEVIGGHYHNNTKDGIDTFVSGQDVSIVGAHLTDNLVDGINCKYSSVYTGTGGGKGGYNRRVIINGNIIKGNHYYGIALETDNPAFAPPFFVVSNNIVTNNTLRGVSVQGLTQGTFTGNIAEENGQNGFRFISCSDLVIQGNIASNNYTSGTGEGFIFGNAGGAFGPNERLTIIGNRAYGSTTQTMGFCLASAHIQNSTIIGNGAYNHSSNWSVSSVMTGMKFSDNDGYVSRNRGMTPAIATGTKVNHGLSQTPGTVFVTAAEPGPTGIYVDAVGGTSFSINFSGGGGKKFYWEAVAGY